MLVLDHIVIIYIIYIYKEKINKKEKDGSSNNKFKDSNRLYN